VAPSLVQVRQATGSFSQALTAPTTAGNCVVACIFAYATTNVTISVPGVTLGGVNDNFGGLASSQSAFAGGATMFTSIWADPGCSGGVITVAATVTNGTAGTIGGIVVMEWAGLATANVLDQSSTNNGTGTSWSSGSTPATAYPAEAVIGAAMVNGNVTGPGSPWTDYLVGPSGNKPGAAGQMVTSATGAQSFAGTQSASAVWAAAVVTLAPPPPPRPNLFLSQAVKRAASW